MTKFGSSTVEGPSKQGRKNSNFLIVYAKYIKVSGYASKCGKDKFDKFRAPKWANYQNSKFLTIQAGNMKLSELVNIKQS